MLRPRCAGIRHPYQELVHRIDYRQNKISQDENIAFLVGSSILCTRGAELVAICVGFIERQQLVGGRDTEGLTAEFHQEFWDFRGAVDDEQPLIFVEHGRRIKGGVIGCCYICWNEVEGGSGVEDGVCEGSGW
jgi:hypothetical protein